MKCATDAVEKVTSLFLARKRMPVSAGRSAGSAVSFWFSQLTSSRLVTWEISQGGWECKGLGSKSSKIKRAIGTCGQRELKDYHPGPWHNFSRLQPLHCCSS